MSINNTDFEFGSIKWRKTPWDQKAFGYKTIEILELKCKTIEGGKKILENFQENVNARLIYGRFDASNQFLKRVLFLNGFFQCETSLKIRKNKLHLNELPKMIKGRELILNDHLREGDKNYIIDKTQEMYSYSRFHEDPFILKKDANKRMCNWVNQLLENNTPVLCHIDKNDNITSYLFYEFKSDKIDMILGGSIPGKGMYAPFFFGGVLNYFKDNNFKTLTTSVSAANKGILSLYITLGFNVTNINSDYHKHIK